MSYQTYGPPVPGQHASTPTTFPYGAYAPAAAYGQPHPQTPGATPYGYATGVTGYGAWPGYAFNYAPSPQQAHVLQPTGQLRPQLKTTSSSTAIAQTPASATPQNASFAQYTPVHSRDILASAGSGGGSTSRGKKQANFKGLFSKELKNLMYGFGDDRNTGNDTVNVMEEILIEYITDVCQAAGGPGKKTRLSVDDLRRVLSRPPDAKKLARMEELMFMQEEIKRARTQFEESDLGQSKGF